MSYFELGMLICFGISWPFNLAKSIKTRSTKGKSLVFLLAIEIGYVLGIIHKLLYSMDFALVVYVINLAMVSADLVLYFINKKRENALQTAV